MNNYEITHKGIKYKAKGEKLMKTMMYWCFQNDIDLDEVESCVLVKTTNRFSKLKIKHSFISDLVLDCKRSSGAPFSTITGHSLRIDFVSKNSGDADTEISDLFSRLSEMQANK